MSLLCRFLGHKCNVITGFRNVDGALISSCKRCRSTVVWGRYQASRQVMQDLYGDGPWSYRIRSTKAAKP